MNKDTKHTNAGHCKECHEQIPLGTALNFEGKDYIYHFCGADCLKKWEESQPNFERKS